MLLHRDPYYRFSPDFFISNKETIVSIYPSAIAFHRYLCPRDKITNCPVLIGSISGRFISNKSGIREKWWSGGWERFTRSRHEFLLETFLPTRGEVEERSAGQSIPPPLRNNRAGATSERRSWLCLFLPSCPRSPHVCRANGNANNRAWSQFHTSL